MARNPRGPLSHDPGGHCPARSWFLRRGPAPSTGRFPFGVRLGVSLSTGVVLVVPDFLFGGGHWFFSPLIVFIINRFFK